MDQVEPTSTRRNGVWATLAIAAVTSASAVTIALPATSHADPEVPTPVPPTTTAAPAPAQAPAQANTPPAPAAQAPNGQPAPVDPNAAPANPNAAPPPPADPNAPPPPPVDPNFGRITNAVGGFSYVLPAGWVESDASHLDYGSALLSKATSPGVYLNPFSALPFASSAAGSISVDKGTSLYDLTQAAMALRNPQTGTVPIANANYLTSAGDSILWNHNEALALFRALQNNKSVPAGLLTGTQVGSQTG